MGILFHICRYTCFIIIPHSSLLGMVFIRILSFGLGGQRPPLSVTSVLWIRRRPPLRLAQPLKDILVLSVYLLLRKFKFLFLFFFLFIMKFIMTTTLVLPVFGAMILISAMHLRALWAATSILDLISYFHHLLLLDEVRDLNSARFCHSYVERPKVWARPVFYSGILMLVHRHR